MHRNCYDDIQLVVSFLRTQQPNARIKKKNGQRRNVWKMKNWKLIPICRRWRSHFEPSQWKRIAQCNKCEEEFKKWKENATLQWAIRANVPEQRDRERKNELLISFVYLLFSTSVLFCRTLSLRYLLNKLLPRNLLAIWIRAKWQRNPFHFIAISHFFLCAVIRLF